CGPEAPDRSANRQSGNRVPRRWHPATVQGKGASRLEDTTPPAVEHWQFRGDPRERHRRARPEVSHCHARTHSVRASVPGDSMSTFFRALERAEQERALRRPTTPSESANAPSPADPAPETV